jgi:hypothetical protein
MTIQSVAQQLNQELNGPLPSEGSTSSSNVRTPGSGDACGALLPQPDVIGGLDIGAEIALLSIRAGRDEEMIQQTTEEAQDNIQDVAEQNEVNEMHTEASDIMSLAIASGVMSMAQGACQIGAGAVTADSAANAASSGASGQSNYANTPAALQAQGASQGLTGMATLYGAGAAFMTAEGQSQRELDEALVTSYKAVADRAGQMSQEASQGQTDARSVISNAVQFYLQYEQTQAQIDLVAAGQKA